MARKEVIPLFIGLMLLTGVCNTLLTKYQDNICVRDCNTISEKKFEKPVIQTLQMFIGEMGTWLFVVSSYIARKLTSGYPNPNHDDYQPINSCDLDQNVDVASIHSITPITLNVRSSPSISENKSPLKGWRVVLLGLPAIFDICGTTLMNIGLLFVAPSIYQMTRGTLVCFVGLFSVKFLKRKLHLFQWSGLLIVVLGVGIVGLAGASKGDKQATQDNMSFIRQNLAVMVKVKATSETLRTIIGVLLIASAQIFTATQFVLEEFIVSKFATEPLKIVGWEGIFGFLVTTIAMIVMHLLVGRTSFHRNGYFDMVDGWHQIIQNKSVWLSSILIMISIGGFNYFGLTVTQHVSATSRSTIDTFRTLFIWVISLLLRWETFKWFQLLGFGLLVYGTFLFNELITPPLNACIPEEAGERFHEV